MSSTPITIVGGGPAGAAAAMALARMGLPCRVLEGDAVPRVKAGETLPANVRPVLQQLGLSELLSEGGHLPCHGNVAFWGGEAPATREFIADVHGHGWHLDRRLFERQLQVAAVAAGVDWQSGVRVQAMARTEAGWALQVRRAPLAQPYTSHGRSITEDVVRVTWTAKSKQDMLPAAFYDEFVLAAQMPAAPGMVYWPVVQTCEEGRNDWTQVPAPGQPLSQLKSPAAALEIMPVAGGAAHSH